MSGKQTDSSVSSRTVRGFRWMRMLARKRSRSLGRRKRRTNGRLSKFTLIVLPDRSNLFRSSAYRLDAEANLVFDRASYTSQKSVVDEVNERFKVRESSPFPSFAFSETDSFITCIGFMSKSETEGCRARSTKGYHRRDFAHRQTAREKSGRILSETSLPPRMEPDVQLIHLWSRSR